ncbi:MAG: DUF493 domain-containing protein [Flavobacteriales bacterium]
MDEQHQQRLREQLNQMHVWPSIYMFKFVLPSDPDRIQELKLIFDESAEFRHRLSTNGKYTSITIREMMLNADAIFERYQRAAKIRGILSL